MTPDRGLFCFAVVSVEFGDVPRAISILDSGSDAGFSGCDEWRILSNVSRLPEISRHPRCAGGTCVERAIRGSMDVPFGKPDNVIWAATALNTPIFLQVWKHVLRSGAYRRHEWTVKTEVDVVFSGSHLRSMLMASGHAARAVLVRNRPDTVNFIQRFPAQRNKYGLVAGPIEALTRKAVDALGQHFAVCVETARRNPKIGEDWWIEKCAEDLRVVEFRLMSKLLVDKGSHTKASRHKNPCDVGAAAYHPLTAPEDWSACYDQLRMCTPFLGSTSCDRSGIHDCAHDDGSYARWCCCRRTEREVIGHAS